MNLISIFYRGRGNVIDGSVGLNGLGVLNIEDKLKMSVSW